MTTRNGKALEGSEMLGNFLRHSAQVVQAQLSPSDVVTEIAPAMCTLLAAAPAFLQAQHRRSDPSAYARNLVYAAPDGSLALFALVWLAGQWTPVHDHGTWGVVGVLEGMLVEQAYMRLDADQHSARATGIRLTRGGRVLLAPGSVSTFVPNPDHIHMTGAPDDGSQVVSLHLYGRKLSSFNVYDVNAGTREHIAAAHYEN